MLKFTPAAALRGNEVLIAKFARARVFSPSKLLDRAVAQACGVTPQAVSGWRRTGRIDKRRLAKVADLTGIALEWWLDGNPDSEPIPAEKTLAPKPLGTGGGLAAQQPLNFYGDPLVSRLLDAFSKLSDVEQAELVSSVEERAVRTQQMYAELKARESPAAAAFGRAVSDHEVERKMKLRQNPPT